MNRYLAIASLATVCALLAGCSSEADEIAARLNGQSAASESLAANEAAGDGLTDEQLPDGVEVSLDRVAAATTGLTLYGEPSPVAGVVGSVPAGVQVQVIGAVRRLDGARWYDVQYETLAGYVCGGLNFAVEEVPEPTATPDGAVTPEPTAVPGDTIVPEPTSTPAVSETLAPTETPTATPTPTETPSPVGTQTPEPGSTPEPTVTEEPTISPTPTATEDPEQPVETALHLSSIVCADGVRLYERPDSDETAVATVDRGTELQIVSAVHTSDGTEWYGVVWQGAKAYVPSDMVEAAIAPTATSEPTVTPGPTATTVMESTATPDPTAATATEPTVIPDPTASTAPKPTETPDGDAATTAEPTVIPERSAAPELGLAPEWT